MTRRTIGGLQGACAEGCSHGKTWDVFLCAGACLPLSDPFIRTCKCKLRLYEYAFDVLKWKNKCTQITIEAMSLCKAFIIQLEVHLRSFPWVIISYFYLFVADLRTLSVSQAVLLRATAWQHTMKREERTRRKADRGLISGLLCRTSGSHSKEYEEYYHIGYNAV